MTYGSYYQIEVRTVVADDSGTIVEAGAAMNNAFPSETRCAWCIEERTGLTKDHVIPRSIGGTLEFALPACTRCQGILSTAERTLARNSLLAIHALASQVPPRHPRRSASGVLQVHYLLVKNPLGGYGESALHCGERMESLAHCEIKVVPGKPPEGRTRGESREQVDALFAKFRDAISKIPEPDGFVCQVNVSLELPQEIKDDPDFWPRMVLLPNGNLLLRARDPKEAERFTAVLTEFVLRGAPRSPAAWKSAVIEGGTQHHISLRYNPRAVRQVVAKIAYGLFRLVIGLELDRDTDHRLRTYILGKVDGGPEPVEEVPRTVPLVTGSTPYHAIALGPQGAVVRLYGYEFRVDLGSESRRVEQPVVVLCSTDGSGMRIANAHEAEEALAAAASLDCPHPSDQN